MVLPSAAFITDEKMKSEQQAQPQILDSAHTNSTAVSEPKNIHHKPPK